MRTAQVARRFSQAEWGGTETVILELSKRLLELGHPTQILCTTATANRRREVIEGVEVIREPYFYPYFGLSRAARARLDRKGGSPFSFSLMRRLAALPGLDLIHSHVANRIGGIVRHVARRRGIPYLISIHGGLFDVPPAEVESWTAPTRGAFEWGKVLGAWVGARRVLPDASAILCVSHRDAELARQRFPHQRVVHLPNGVDPERFQQGDGKGFRARHGIAQDRLVLATIARIDSQKNQLLLVELLPELLHRQPRAHLLLVGPPTDQAYYQLLQRTVSGRQLDHHVTIITGLPGGSQEIADAYHACDLFLLPSIHEPFGIVVLEAWCAGRPVIASRVGGIPWFVEDGRDALLCDPAQPGQWVRAVDELLSHPERARELAEAGRAKARQRFSWDSITRELLTLYEEVVRDHRPG